MSDNRFLTRNQTPFKYNKIHFFGHKKKPDWEAMKMGVSVRVPSASWMWRTCGRTSHPRFLYLSWSEVSWYRAVCIFISGRSRVTTCGSRSAVIPKTTFQSSFGQSGSDGQNFQKKPSGIKVIIRFSLPARSSFFVNKLMLKPYKIELHYTGEKKAKKKKRTGVKLYNHKMQTL